MAIPGHSKDFVLGGLVLDKILLTSRDPLEGASTGASSVLASNTTLLQLAICEDVSLRGLPRCAGGEIIPSVLGASEMFEASTTVLGFNP